MVDLTENRFTSKTRHCCCLICLISLRSFCKPQLWGPERRNFSGLYYIFEHWPVNVRRVLAKVYRPSPKLSFSAFKAVLLYFAFWIIWYPRALSPRHYYPSHSWTLIFFSMIPPAGKMSRKKEQPQPPLLNPLGRISCIVDHRFPSVIAWKRGSASTFRYYVLLF